MRNRMDREFRYILRRSPKLQDAEHRLLSVLGSYEHGFLQTYDKLCEITGWSRSKLNRTIKILKKYQLIEITYKDYKKTIIKIVSAQRQKEFSVNSDVSLVAHQPCATHDTTMCHQWHDIVPPVAHPILEYQLERKLESSFSEDEKFDVGQLIANAFPKWNR